jgi:hypothetical protein
MADSNDSEKVQQDHMPLALVTAPLLYIVLLAVSLLSFSQTRVFNIFGLAVPAAVLWFGTLGGLISSLQGMFFHNQKWKKSYNLWHFFSGTVGATYGLASYLFLLVVVKSTVSGSAQSDAPVFALAAFAIGYGQSQFHSMMNQVFTLIFHPSKGSASDTTDDVTLRNPRPKTTPPNSDEPPT